MARAGSPSVRAVAGVALVLVAGFAAAACLLTGLHLRGDPGSVLHQATRLAWALAALALTGVGALAWSRVHRARRPPSLAVAVLSTAAWTAVALAAGWDTVR